MPGHMAVCTLLDTSAIRHTREYLQRFDVEAATAKAG